MTTTVTPTLTTLAEGLRFPEGPVLMPDGSIALVEIESGLITAITPGGEKKVLAKPGGGPNGMALGPNGKLYLCNNGGFLWHEEPNILRPAGVPADYETGRIEVVDPATGSVTRLIDTVGGHKLRGPNDIMFDPREGFWFSDLGKVRGRDRDHGGVYWSNNAGTDVRECAYPIFGGANGIGISPDGKTLYVAETETGRLWAWDVEAPGVLKKEPWPSSNGGRVLCQFPGYRRLDSLAIAASGNIVVATLVAGEITTISPSGEILHVAKMPERMPTNICFGGPGLNTAFITLSNTGKLVSCPWHEAGYKLPYG